MASAPNDTIIMTVSTVTVDPVTGLHGVLLEPVSPTARVASLCIPVGASEASAIKTKLDSIEFERPCTHKLMGMLLAASGSGVERVEIYGGAARGSYRARIHLRLADGSQVTEEVRPSDGLALALYMNAVIEVARNLVSQARRSARGMSQAWRAKRSRGLAARKRVIDSDGTDRTDRVDRTGQPLDRCRNWRD